MRRRRHIPWLPILALLVIGGGYSAYWKVVHDQALAIMDAEIDAWRAAGFDASWSERTSGGFPLKVEAVFEDPAVASPPGADAWRWSGAQLSVLVYPWSINQITIAPAGLHTVTTRESGEINAEAERLRINARSDAEGLEAITLTSGRTSVVRRGDGATLFAAAGADATLVRADDDPGAYALTAEALEPEWLDGENAEPRRIAADLTVTATETLALQGRLDEVALSTWSDAGGEVHVRDLRAAWDDSDIGVMGDLAIDDRGEWSGRVTLASTAPTRAIGHLAELGVIDRDAAAMVARLGAAMPAGGDALGGLSFDVRDGGIYVLGQRLGDIAPAY